jgi:hypothetical protein
MLNFLMDVDCLWLSVIIELQFDFYDSYLFGYTVQTIKSITQGIVQNQERQDLLKWLSHLSVSTRHLESIKKRVEGTGKWLLKDQKFLQWSSRTAECRTLCCYGDAGAGKTIIW